MKAGLLRSNLSLNPSSNIPSFSSSIYAVITRALRVPLTYDMFEIPPAEFDSFMTNFANSKILGLNVTIPYKEKVIKYLTKQDATVLSSKACNVIKVEGKDVCGFNTDIFGIQKTFEETGVVVKNKKCVVFGSGGAAKAAVIALKDADADSISVISRNPTQAKIKGVEIKNYGPNFLDADIFINATPSKDPYEGKFKKEAFVFDMTYRYKQTEFLKSARDQGASTCSGLNMLIWQALKTWEIWFNQTEQYELKNEIFNQLHGELI